MTDAREERICELSERLSALRREQLRPLDSWCEEKARLVAERDAANERAERLRQSYHDEHRAADAGITEVEELRTKVGQLRASLDTAGRDAARKLTAAEQRAKQAAIELEAANVRADKAREDADTIKREWDATCEALTAAEQRAEEAEVSERKALVKWEEAWAERDRLAEALRGFVAYHDSHPKNVAGIAVWVGRLRTALSTTPPEPEHHRWVCEESGCAHAGTCQAAGRPACYEVAPPEPERATLPTVALDVSGDVFSDGGCDPVEWHIYAEAETEHAARTRVWVAGKTVADVTIHVQEGGHLPTEVQEVSAGLLWSALRAAHRDRANPSIPTGGREGEETLAERLERTKREVDAWPEWMKKAMRSDPQGRAEREATTPPEPEREPPPDFRPRCCKCGEKWLPPEGVNALETPCPNCTPTGGREGEGYESRLEREARLYCEALDEKQKEATPHPEDRSKESSTTPSLVEGVMDEPEERSPPQTWCPQCGPHVRCDEDGCCAMCGCDCTGDGADQALAALAYAERHPPTQHCEGCEVLLKVARAVASAKPECVVNKIGKSPGRKICLCGAGADPGKEHEIRHYAHCVILMARAALTAHEERGTKEGE